MTPRKKFGAVLLLMFAATLPESVWLGAHALRHHGHDGHEELAGHDHEGDEPAETAQIAALAAVLVHRHSHDENVPDHEHHLSSAPACREAGQRGLAAVPAALSPTLGGSAGEVRVAPGGRRPAAGSGPPLLALLCTLRV